MDRAHQNLQGTLCGGSRRLSIAKQCLLVAVLLGSGLLTGCAAWTNPVAHGIPVWAVPQELLAKPKENLAPIPLSSLKQQPPTEYLLGPRDILGVFVEKVLGQADQNPPVTMPDVNGISNLPPSLGFPISVREDGTVPLPLVDPVHVEGMTLAQAEKAVKDAYTVKRKILAAGQERVIVTLMRPRTTRVLVIRQDSPGVAGANVTVGAGYTRGLLGASPSFSATRHGAGTIVDLPAYENDVLTALTQTGGLPGFDAKNEVRIDRHALKSTSPDSSGSGAEAAAAEAEKTSAGDREVETVKIPLRLPASAPLPFKPDSIILHEGDVVSIEARDAEVFYTGGFLPPGEHALPRDYDLDVVKAISAIGGPLVNGGVNANNLTGSLAQQGIGSFSPKLVSVLRKTPHGGQCTIIVDLDCALQNPRSSLLLKAGDVVILQETKGQALVRYFDQIFHTGLNSIAIETSRTTGTVNVAGP
ncbi:MAG: polysaccharide biosynthesis/export family protein [Thermoguttaceae bacterium]